MGAKEISFDANPTAPIKPGSLYYVDLRQSTTPEIYIGYNTARTPLGNPEGFKHLVITNLTLFMRSYFMQLKILIQ
jgi:hypothetical protein